MSYPAAAAEVLDGKSIALEWEKSIAAEAAQLTKEIGRKPGLAVIIAGSRPDSAIYVQRKQDACKRVRMHQEDVAGASTGGCNLLCGESHFDPIVLAHVSRAENELLPCCSVQVGIESRLYKLPENAVEADVQTIVEQLSNDTHVDGILVQLPLPGDLRDEIILQDISPVKDVDGGCAKAVLQRCTSPHFTVECTFCSVVG